MNPEPGWYYAEGDPPNTLRRWNGVQWIGFPIEQRSESNPNHVVGVKPFKPIPGQVAMGRLSAVTVVALLLCIGAHAFFALTVWQNSTFTSLAALTEEPPLPIANGFAVVFVTCLLGGLIFITWFSVAYRNLHRWHKAQRGPGWAPIVFFVPFVQYRWPWDMMLEMVERSARPDRQGEITPFAVMGWWAMWTFHQSLFAASIGLNRFTDLGASSYQLAIAGSVAAIIGLVCAIYLVHSLGVAQDTRRQPTKAQRALMMQQAQTQPLV